MKNGQEILGRPVFAIAEGKEVGQVKEAIVDPKEKKIKALLIETNTWYEGLKMLPFIALKSVAEMVMIESQAEIIPLVEVRESESLKKGLKILDKKVITTEGNFIGKVTNFLVEPKTGKITELEVELTEDSHQKERFSWNHLISLGEEALVIEEQSEVRGQRSEVRSEEPKPAQPPPVIPTLSEVEGEESRAGEEPKEEALKQKLKEAIKEAKEIATETEEVAVEKPGPEEEAAQPTDVGAGARLPTPARSPSLRSGASGREAEGNGGQVSARPDEKKGGLKKFLEERQDKYLLGKRVGKDLLAPDGNLIAKAGEEITEEILNKAKETKRYLALSFFAKEK